MLEAIVHVPIMHRPEYLLEVDALAAVDALLVVDLVLVEDDNN